MNFRLMKRILIALGFALCPSAIFSQEYHPFNFNDGQWVCGYDTKGGHFSNYEHNYYIKEEVKFYCDGDTIINDTLFYKLFYEGTARYPDWAKRKLSGYYGEIRNDTLNRQVWLGDFLLYDFNLQIGDSVFYGCDRPQPIESIDSVLYCNQWHNRYNYTNDNGDNLYVIEGIGSIFGLIPRNCATNLSWLTCYGETGHVSCDTCSTPTYVYNIAFKDIKIYPVPASDWIFIRHTEVEELSVTIYSLLGKEVLSLTISAQSKIDVSHLKEGLYLIQISSEKKDYFDKIVISR